MLMKNLDEQVAIYKVMLGIQTLSSSVMCDMRVVQE
jgi:hypothetical protein